MIKEVIGGGPFVNVSGGSNYNPYINMNNTSAGLTRWNGNTNNFEVYDGSTWFQLHSNVVNVALTGEATSAISWALAKMEEERKLNELMAQHPGLRDAHEKFEIMRVLVTQEEKGAQ